MNKKGVLFLVSTILILGLLNSVGAVDSVNFAKNASLLNVTNITGTPLHVFNQGFYLNNQSIGMAVASPSASNASFLLNISINNSIMDLGGDSDSGIINITNITIELPEGLSFQDLPHDGNITQLSPDAQHGKQVPVNFMAFYDGSTHINQFVQYNSSVNTLSNGTVSHGGGGADAFSGVIITLNVTVRNSSGITEGSNDIVVRISNNSGGGDNSITHNFTLNLTLDFTAPALSVARTNNTLNSLNVSFNELINVSELVICTPFNFTNFTQPTRYNVTTIATSAEGHDTIEGHSFAVNLDASYFQNDTPVILINNSGCIKDLAGNPLFVDNTSQGYSTSNLTVLDAAQPSINSSDGVGITYNHFTRELIIGFNESVDAGSFNANQTNITAHASAGASDNEFTTVLNHSSPLPITSSNNNFTITVTIPSHIADRISGFRESGLNISINASAITDLSGNILNEGGSGINVFSNRSITIYVNDTEAGNFSTNSSSITYDEHTGILTLTYNETVDKNTVNLNGIFLSLNASSLTIGGKPSPTVNISGATVLKGNNDTVVQITLNQAENDNVSRLVKGDSTPTIYLIHNNSDSGGFGVKDVGGTLIVDQLENRTVINSFTVKASPPALITLITFNSTFGRDIFDEDETIKAGASIFSLVFNDSMDNGTGGTANITHANGAVDIATCVQQNATVFNCTATITTGDDGIATVKTGAFRLANAITTMEDNITNTVNVDTVDPTIEAVAYRDADPASASTLNDSILIQFSENITVVTLDDGRLSATDRSVGSDAQIFNLTVEGDRFNGSDAALDSASQMEVGATFRGNVNNSFLNISINNSNSNITTRGIYSASKNLDGNASGLSLVINQTIVMDYAGNLASDTTEHDIADGIVEFDANQLEYFSVPFCIDSSLINAQLPDETGYIKSFNNNGFTTITSGALNALSGYQANFTVDFNMFVYTKSAKNCALTSHVLTINQNYTLLGVDNDTQANATHLFSSLGDGSQVNNLYTGTDLTTLETTVAEYNARTINPFGAYWIFPDFDATTKQFNGLGVN